MVAIVRVMESAYTENKICQNIFIVSRFTEHGKGNEISGTRGAANPNSFQPIAWQEKKVHLN